MNDVMTHGMHVWVSPVIHHPSWIIFPIAPASSQASKLPLLLLLRTPLPSPSRSRRAHPFSPRSPTGSLCAAALCVYSVIMANMTCVHIQPFEMRQRLRFVVRVAFTCPFLLPHFAFHDLPLPAPDYVPHVTQTRMSLVHCLCQPAQLSASPLILP